MREASCKCTEALPHLSCPVHYADNALLVSIRKFCVDRWEQVNVGGTPYRMVFVDELLDFLNTEEPE